MIYTLTVKDPSHYDKLSHNLMLIDKDKHLPTARLPANYVTPLYL
jgi:hypothetical protein